MTIRRKIGGLESMYRMAENGYRSDDRKLQEKVPPMVIRRRRKGNM
jgi:hypothetical protein